MYLYLSVLLIQLVYVVIMSKIVDRYCIIPYVTVENEGGILF